LQIRKPEVQLTQKICCQPQQLLEVHSGSAEDGIQAIADRSPEAAAVHSMFPFQMSDAWFNGGSTFHPSPEAFSGSSSSILINMNIDVTGVSVAAASHVHKYVLRWVGDSFGLR
jgi:hypothetical protein